MANSSTLPPDVPKDWDEAKDEVERAGDGIRAKAAGLASSVKSGYERAKDAMGEIDAGETLREAGRVAQEKGEVAIRAVERHPAVAFGLGALSAGLIAWAYFRPTPPTPQRWEPDYGRLRQLFSDYGGDELLKAGRERLKSGESWLRSSSDVAQDYARDGSRMLVKRSEKEPLAALLGIGIALYALGSMLSSSSEPAPPARRRPAKRA